MSIKIVLVDDQEIVRAGLRLLLESQPDMQVVGAAKDQAETLALCDQALPDVVVMGLEIGGLEITRAIRQQYPSIIIVALTAYEDSRHLIEMAQAGASAHLPKHAALADLVSAIRAACAGQIVLHPSIAATLVEGYRQRARADHTVRDQDHLAPQENQFLDLLAQGAQNKDIARQMGVSFRTVARYQAALLRKLGLHSRGELVRYAIDRGQNK